MSTTNSTTGRTPNSRPSFSQYVNSSRWLVPGIGLVAGIAYLIIGLVNDRPATGVNGLLITLAYSAFLLLFGRRSEAVGLLAGDGSDELSCNWLPRHAGGLSRHYRGTPEPVTFATSSSTPAVNLTPTASALSSMSKRD
jgi:hypothetical protein